MVFFRFVLLRFTIEKVCFWCVWHCFKSVKNACFPQFLGFSGEAYCCSSGFGRFRCFCVLVFVLLFCVAFVSVLFALLLVLLLDCLVLVLLFLCFCFLFLFLCFCFFCLVCFFGGFKGQVRWPKGPPHLALNPPYLLIFFGFLFVFVCFCLVFMFLFGPPHLALNPPYFLVFLSFLCF